MIIRAGNNNDIGDALQFFANARKYMNSSGIDQWQQNPPYPNEGSLKQDASDNAWYVVQKSEDDTGIVATFMTATMVDETYEAPLVSGEWKTSGTKYAVLHRVAVCESAKGQGIGCAIVVFTCKKAAQTGAVSVRCDTHADNKSMRRMLEKNGFDYCAQMKLPDGAPRVAYELVLK